jgi:hypothetical protein
VSNFDTFLFASFSEQASDYLPAFVYKNVLYAMITSQALSLPLLRGSITLEEALQQEEDMLLETSYPDSRIEFFVFLYGHRNEIAELVSGHLGLDQPNRVAWEK